jgi:hypothetical protein
MNPLVYDCIPWLGHARVPARPSCIGGNTDYILCLVVDPRRMSERHVRHPELVGMSISRTYDLLTVPIVSGIRHEARPGGSPVETPT